MVKAKVNETNTPLVNLAIPASSDILEFLLTDYFRLPK